MAPSSFVVVANRLPVDEVTIGERRTWRRSPGGLVTALHPVLAAQHGTSLMQVIQEVGVAIKLIRPSTRIRRSVPLIDWQEITPPPVDLRWLREPRYAHKTHDTRSRSSKKAKTEPGII